MPPGDENAELSLPSGMTPVRLSENQEVVWVDRLDPARCVIKNVPTPQSKRRYKDLLLSDGAPMGTRTIEGRQYPRFRGTATDSSL